MYQRFEGEPEWSIYQNTIAINFLCRSNEDVRKLNQRPIEQLQLLVLDDKIIMHRSSNLNSLSCATALFAKMDGVRLAENHNKCFCTNQTSRNFTSRQLRKPMSLFWQYLMCRASHESFRQKIGFNSYRTARFLQATMIFCERQSSASLHPVAPNLHYWVPLSQSLTERKSSASLIPISQDTESTQSYNYTRPCLASKIK